MHIYKGKYKVLAPYWSIKRKQDRNWRIFLFSLVLSTSFDLMVQSDPFFTLFVSLFVLLKAMGWKDFPECSLFIYWIREVKGPRAGWDDETWWGGEGPATAPMKRNGGYCPRTCCSCWLWWGRLWEYELSISFAKFSFIFFSECNAHIDCGPDFKIKGNFINTLTIY